MVNLDKLVNLISLDLFIYKIVPPLKSCGKEPRSANDGSWVKSGSLPDFMKSGELRMVFAF